MRRLSTLLLASSALAATPLLAQDGANPMSLEAHWPPTLEQYLPEGVSYDAEFPRPESVLGWPVGTWHVRHDQLVRWFEVIAENSDRVVLEEYGRTHEARPLVLAVVTSPANHARLEELRSAHVDAVREGRTDHDGPAVAWMGYGVHGNESSASNASLLLGYHLAAATGDEIERFLEDTIVLIDPCVNPDGGSRFAHWANSHRGANLSGAPSHREHTEGWPSGRTNHYWFDLNRDWLLLTHPESRGRVAQYQRWQPMVLTDYHEMGSGSTYFFQPGIPSRRNPLTPPRNAELTGRIAEFHAEALDAKGSLYFTEERFDDFYYGKGSTYPDVQGSIGILFEQASSRGHLVETSHGELTFPFTIENQFTTSLTTLAAVDAMRDELGKYQRGFFQSALLEAESADVQGWVFGDAKDPVRAREMVRRLAMHDIAVHELAKPTSGFGSATSWVVPARQPQYRLVRALFETRTSWKDNTFYDVSSWTFPLSFDVPYRAIERDGWSDELLGDRVDGTESEEPAALAIPDGPVPAFAFEWHRTDASAALTSLLKADVNARVATRAFGAATPGGAKTFSPGTIVVATGPQDVNADSIAALMSEIHASGIEVTPILSGLTPEGADLGSGRFAAIELPRVAIVVGDRVSAYEAGATWHDLDTRVGLGVTLVERSRLSESTLREFTHVVLVSGATSGWGDAELSRMRGWVADGGVLIATKRSAVWAADRMMGQAHIHEEPPHEEGAPTPRPYADYEDLRAVQRVAGTIFRASVDTTHPIAFGFTRDEIPVFRNFESVLPEGDDPFATPVRYRKDPLISGFASPENVAKVAGSPAIRVERVGSGTVVAMIDDPTFRGVWYGTRRFLVNAVFFGKAVGRTGPIGDRTEDEELDYDHGHAHNR